MTDTGAHDRILIVDCLQYCNWSEAIFREIQETGIAAIHATISYHGNFQAMLRDIMNWNRRFEDYASMIRPGRSAADIVAAKAEGRTAIFFGLQNPSPMEDDIGLLEVAHDLGVRFMQLTYNNQSLLASGCYEARDGGISTMGREVIAEMNRLGMVIDMSHSGTLSTMEAIDLSNRPIAVTHANPHAWHPVPRNKPDNVIKAIGESGGMLGFSLYTYHLKGGVGCTIEDFAIMVARTAELVGVDCLGIGSDLCQSQPDSVVTWMRNGNWTKSSATASFPPQPEWFRSNRDFPGIAAALARVGFDKSEVAKIMGGNWLRFYEGAFSRQPSRLSPAPLAKASSSQPQMA